MEKRRKCNTCGIIKDLRNYVSTRKSNKKVRIVMCSTVTQETIVDGRFAGQLNIKVGRMKFCPECGRKLPNNETIFDKKITEE